MASAIVKYHITERARQVVNDAMDILGGKVSEEVREMAIRKLQDGQPGRVDEALDAAAEEERKQKEREAARRARLTARAKFSTQTINPFDIFDVKPVAERGWDKGKTLSDAQAAILRKQGIDPDTMPYGQARQILNEMFRRWDTGMCTFGQAKILRKRGLPTNVTREEAGHIIDGIAEREGWKKKAVA